MCVWVDVGVWVCECWVSEGGVREYKVNSRYLFLFLTPPCPHSSSPLLTPHSSSSSSSSSRSTLRMSVTWWSVVERERCSCSTFASSTSSCPGRSSRGRTPRCVCVGVWVWVWVCVRDGVRECECFI